MFNNQKGFTLIELMVVVVIIGILAAIALPNFLSMQDRAKESEVKANVHTVQLSVEDYKTQFNGAKPTSFITTPSTASPAATQIPATLKNPFTGTVAAAAINATEGLGSIPTLNNPNTAGSALTQGQVGYTMQMGGTAGQPYIITGTGKWNGTAAKYVAVTSEGM